MSSQSCSPGMWQKVDDPARETVLKRRKSISFYCIMEKHLAGDFPDHIVVPY